MGPLPACLSAYLGVVFPSDSIPELYSFSPNVVADRVIGKCQVQPLHRAAEVRWEVGRGSKRPARCLERQRIRISVDRPAWHAGDACTHMVQQLSAVVGWESAVVALTQMEVNPPRS